MKIVFLQDDFPPQSFGGAGISTYELAKGMLERGHDVSVVTTVRTHEEAGKVTYDGLTVYKLMSDYPGRWRAYVSLKNRQIVGKVREILNEIKPDVVHINNIHTHLSYYSFKLAKQIGAKVVFTARDVMTISYGKLATDRYIAHLDPKLTWLDNIYQARKRWNPFRNIIIKHYLQYADHICSVSDALREALELNGIRNIRTVHTGVNYKAEAHAGDFKREYNLEGKRVILFSGRLSEGKGGRKAIEALSLVVKDVPEAVLLVAGKTDWYSDLMLKEATKLGVGGQVIFTGWLTGRALYEVYNGVDVVIVPSLSLDALPRVVLESMALGKAVVGSQFGGSGEVIEDGVSGYIVNPFNPEEIAEKTVVLLEDDELRERMGRRAEERIRNDFNLDKMVSKYLTVYAEV